MLKSKSIPFCLFALGLSFVSAQSAWALGFGQPASRAVLGEPLSVTVPVRLNAGEDLSSDCVAADVFFGEDKLGASSVDVAMTGAGASQRMVRVRTNVRVQEPVFTVYLVVGCQTKITRKFVGFADPPGLDIQGAQVVAAEVPPEAVVSKAGSKAAQSSPDLRASVAGTVSQSVVSSTALSPAERSKLAADSAVAAARPGQDGLATKPASPRSAADQKRASASRLSSDASGRPRLPGSNASSARWSAKLDTASPTAKGSPRLELDPAAADAMVEPRLALTGGMNVSSTALDTPEAQARRAAAAALWAAMNASPEELARDRQRMQELEARLARLQLDAAAASKKLQDMEARVREAEDGRFNHPLFYALAGGCVLLAGAALWLFLRQRAQGTQSDAQWWQPAQEPTGDREAESTSPGMLEPELLSSSRLVARDDRQDDGYTQPGALMSHAPAQQSPSDDPSGMGVARGASMAAVAGVATAASLDAQAQQPADANTLPTQPVSLKRKEPVREMSVEELIDLEQQAEFFVVLGQDHAAIELLESHVQSGSGPSPLPYLKLLEIYQRLGQREDYERVQQAFNEQFNAYAPAWDSDLQQGHALQDYPGVVERLQALWSQPRKAMEVLQQSLIRPDDSVETFDLPAYRELLMLYSVARDLSDRQQQEHGQVDIDVPDLLEQRKDVEDTVVAPLTATRPVRAEPQVLPPLSVDVSLDEPLNHAVGTAGSTTPPAPGAIDFYVVPDEPSNLPKKS